MTTVGKNTDVSLHDERDETYSEELVDKSFFFKEMISIFEFEVLKDGEECSDVWTNYFFEWLELKESKKIAERIPLLLSLRDGGV